MTGNRQCRDLKSEREEAEQQQKIRLGSGWVMQTKYFYAKDGRLMFHAIAKHL